MFMINTMQPCGQELYILTVMSLQDEDEWNDDTFEEDDEDLDLDDEDFIESDDGDGDFDTTGRALDENPYGELDE